MAEPFLAEVRIMSFNFPPKGWALCNGQFMPINQNQALFALLGTTYGGNGQTTFALPNLRGRTPVSAGFGFTLGQAGGAESHTITPAEMPEHLHILNATAQDASQPIPTGAMLARQAPANPFAAANNLTAMHAASVGNVGGSQAHTNMQPYHVLNFSIALQGIFPSQN